MARHPLFAIYRLAMRVATPLGGVFLSRRARRGKEDPERIGERSGHAAMLRPQGRLAWLHGASVGEGLALLPLVERLVERGFGVLVTTGTVTSAKLLQARLPAGATHQYAPLDFPRFTARFLDHWRPDLAMLVESELWPNLIADVNKRRIPLVLVNARMSTRSFARWRRARGLIGDLLSRIDLVLAQSEEDARRFTALGAPRVQAAGNLKYDCAPPYAEAADVAALADAIGARPVWLAASTHAGEERICGETHLALAAQFPNLLTIVAPRHPSRGAEAAEEMTRLGLRCARRSQGEAVTAEVQAYLGDTIGEMGLFLRLSKIVFLGKSLAGEGGQNPIEAAKLGCAILHGPHVGNFTEPYRLLDEARGACAVEDGATLAKALRALLSEGAKLRAMAASAHEAVGRQSGAADQVMRAVEPFIGQMLLERRR